jgi:hypothetical protein
MRMCVWVCGLYSPLLCVVKVKVKVLLRMTVSQSVSRGSWPDVYYCLTITVLFLWGALSDERTGLPFLLAADPRQRSLSRVRVPRDSWPYFTVSDMRLSFWSSPTTRRVSVEVFYHASTRVTSELAKVKVKVKVMLQPTVQSASPSWNKAPIWGLRPYLYYCQDSCRLVDVGRSLWPEDGSVVCQTQSAVISLLSVCTICILQVMLFVVLRVLFLNT